MSPRAYYNEKDKYAAQWLRNLADANVIMPGDVDERDIQDVTPDDLKGYTQHHFFAGIGVWSYALREAGWPDERPVWTGSCPCQPFSEAGKGAGFADERHLWPAWFHLARIYRPLTIFGEQVASPDGLAWLDLVSADLEGEGYARGAVDTCAAGFGAPEIRQRLYFSADDERSYRQLAENGELADADYAKWRTERARWNYAERAQTRWEQGYRHSATRRVYDRLADTYSSRFGVEGVYDQPAWQTGVFSAGGGGSDGMGDAHGATGEWGTGGVSGEETAVHRSREPDGRSGHGPSDAGQVDRLADAHGQGIGGRGVRGPGEGVQAGSRAARERSAGLRPTDGLADAASGRREHELGGGERRDSLRPAAPRTRASVEQPGSDGPGDDASGPVNGYWAGASLVWCRDNGGIWRPVEPGSLPLAHESPARMGRLSAYGNAICAEQAIAFIAAYLDEETEAVTSSRD